ncbi:phosphatases II [Macrolepiota fuliginosa MF-IS2]|uniref:Phosphatases II n=1 Tax=Macrolepiota fuliginosa MF-IS2 TaxID=1400762 RepID=A0A9P5XMP6_9AGAR|nr:phosphatases II [Macrolepiota fuliginosa MF-IS2]
MLSFPQQKWQLARTLTQHRASDDVNLIVDRLYLGNWAAAGDNSKLVELGITHVVSVIEFSPDIPDIIVGDNKLHIQINDTSGENISRHLEQTTDFIKSALEADKKNRVLVHCLMGISRSATVVAAYLVATKKMAGGDAIAYLQKKRPIVCPNLGFRQQLDAYASRYMETSEAQFSPIRHIKAWTSVVKMGKGSSESLGPTT